jgi:hypothetical protein
VKGFSSAGRGGWRGAGGDLLGGLAIALGLSGEVCGASGERLQLAA